MFRRIHGIVIFIANTIVVNIVNTFTAKIVTFLTRCLNQAP